MPPIGLAFVLVGILAIRQVVVGRVKDTPEDLKALAVAVLNGDTAGMGAVLSARGTNVSVPDAEVASDPGPTPATGTSPGGGVNANNDIVTQAVKLGNKAKYVWGATGPNSYDCSGLVWATLKSMGLYNGSRFTTHNFDQIGPKFSTKVTTSAVGDIVVWPNHHMGIVTGSDSYYSAKSPSAGIGVGKISADNKYFGMTPEYWRVNN